MNQSSSCFEAPRSIEHGDPSGDSGAFRRCLGQYPTGVTVVTSCVDGRLAGMAVNSFAAVSLDPPLISWSIRKESRSLADFTEVEHFAVNVLAQDQLEVSRRFGMGAADKFDVCPWFAGTNGAPLLQGALVHLECRRVAVHEGGDHLIIIGQVERYHRYEGRPLLFSQGQYGIAHGHPELVEA